MSDPAPLGDPVPLGDPPPSGAPAPPGGPAPPGDPLRALAEIAPDAWLVGGALRDRLLGRPTSDYDVIVPEAGVEAVARRLRRAAGAFVFPLSEAFGAWRVVARDRSWQLDLAGLEAGSIEADLRRRDLTVNAIAQRLSGGDPVDPFGGLADLRARRLRMVSRGAFRDDPVRVLRLARLACELGFEPELQTVEQAARDSSALSGVAAERVFAELRRLLGAERAVQGLELLDRLGAAAVVLPELVALRGMRQSRFHHLDVYDHTLAVLAETIALERDPEATLGPVGAELGPLLAVPLADELTRWQGLRFGALLHDVAKPATRGVTEAGRVTFIGHDELGASMAATILRRLRASERLAGHVAALARHHLRLGFLVHQAPLDRRAVYRYLDACGPVAIDVTLLSVADRLATRGDGAQEAIARHLELARELLGDALAWARDPPRPPVRGDVLAGALGVPPGPLVGELLRELEEAAFAGEVGSQEEAIERGRALLGERQAPAR